MHKKKKLNFAQLNDTRDRPLDATFTEAVPGSTEKVEFMRKRYERGVSLFHNRDRGLTENYFATGNYDWNNVDFN